MRSLLARLCAIRIVSRMSDDREHFLPIRRADLERVLLAEADSAQRDELAGFIAILAATIHDDFHARLEKLKDLYDPINPDRDTITLPDTAPMDEKVLVAEFADVLTRANYRRLDAEELNQALNEESVFQVRLRTRLDDFAELIIYHRGRRTCNEVKHGWFGRQKLISVDYFSRVAIYARFQNQAHFDAQKRGKKLSFKPGTAILKLFQNVPCADIEMLLPNAEVCMRKRDHAMLLIPALAGGVGVLLKFATALVMMWAVVAVWLGLKEDNGSAALNAAILVGFGLAVATLAGFLFRQFNNFKNRRLRFMKELADNLYYRNLDNNAGVFHRLLDEAQEEDGKEALLAYVHLLRAGKALTEAELDERVEAWFMEKFTLDVDFEVDDGLAKLERFGLATREGERWTAKPLTEAKHELDVRWDGKFDF
jgi:hypothetical protein